MKLWPAEIESRSNCYVSGFIVEMPSGARKQVAWSTSKPITPELDAAKEYAAKLLEHLLREGRQDDVGRTNWPSAVAAIQKIIGDFNDHVRKHSPTLH